MGETKGVASVPVDAGSELTHNAGAGGTDDMTTPIGKRTTPAFQFYPNDFLGSSKVQRMSLTERGAYITLLSHCWMDGGLPTDTKTLAAILHVKATQFDRMWSGALHECFYEKNGKLQNARLDRERKKQADYSKAQTERINKRWERARNTKDRNTTVVQEPNTLHLQSSSSSSNNPPNGGLSRARGGAPLIDNREHRKHAVCGRVCLHASQFGDFVRRRNHDGADAEIRDWAAAVIDEWTDGVHRSDEPGDAFDFWRARYDEKWPAPVAAKVDARVPQWAR